MQKVRNPKPRPIEMFVLGYLVKHHFDAISKHRKVSTGLATDVYMTCFDAFNGGRTQEAYISTMQAISSDASRYTDPVNTVSAGATQHLTTVANMVRNNGVEPCLAMLPAVRGRAVARVPVAPSHAPQQPTVASEIQVWRVPANKADAVRDYLAYIGCVEVTA